MFENLRREVARFLAPAEIRQALDQWKNANAMAGRNGYTRFSERIGDLPATDYEKMVKGSIYLKRQNGPAKRAIELMSDFILGNGMSFRTFDNPELENRLQKHWNDEYNRWDKKQHERVELLLTVGECCMPFMVGGDAIIRLGSVSPLLIKKVYVDPFDSTIPVEVVVKDSQGSRELTYAAVRRSPGSGRFEKLFTFKDGEIGELAPSYHHNGKKMVDGLCFMWQLNKDPEQSRGIGELMAAMDWLDGLDFTISQCVSRTTVMNQLAWDVEISNSSQADIEKRAEELQNEPYHPVKYRVHGPGEKWTPLTPSLNAADITAISKMVQNYALGSLGIPEHWYSEGSSENLATAKVMSVPVFRRLLRKQTIIKEMVHSILEYQRDVLWEAGLVREHGDERDRIEVTAPDVAPPDEKDMVAHFKSLAEAMTIALNQGWIEDSEAKQVIQKHVQLLGVTTDEKTITSDTAAYKLDDVAWDDSKADTIIEEGPDPSEPLPLAATALNGAQITGLLEIVAKVEEGALTREAAIAMILAAFPSINEDRARRIVLARGATPMAAQSDIEAVKRMAEEVKQSKRRRKK